MKLWKIVMIAVSVVLVGCLGAMLLIQKNEQNISTETSAASTTIVKIKTDKNDPYSYVVKEHYRYMKSDSFGRMYYYAFYDIDGNGTEELLLGIDSGWGKSLYAIYTIKNGGAVQQKQYITDPVSDPPSLLFQNGTIRSDGNYDGVLDFSYYCFENSELKFQTLLTNDYGSYYRLYVQYGPSKSITKEEFNRVKKEFEGDGQTVELDWKPLAEYGR